MCCKILVLLAAAGASAFSQATARQLSLPLDRKVHKSGSIIMQTPAESPLENPGAGWAKPSKNWSEHDYDELKKAGTKIEYSTLYGNTQGPRDVRKCVCCDHEYTGSPKAMRIHVRAKTEMDKPKTRKDVKECQPKTEEGRDWLKECKEAIERRDAKPLGEKGRGKKKEANREAVTPFDKLRHVPTKEMVDKAWAHAFVKNNISVGTIDDEHFRRAVCLSVMRGRTMLTENDKSEYPERSAETRQIKFICKELMHSTRLTEEIIKQDANLAQVMGDKVISIANKLGSIGCNDRCGNQISGVLQAHDCVCSMMWRCYAIVATLSH